MKFGIVRFPGSCDDIDAFAAAARVGEPVLLWHADHDLQGVDAVIVPGGFSYGDYLRAGAIARFAPVMAEVEEFAREGGLVLGICNGFQVLCEAGLLPGALLPNVSLKFIFRQVDLEVVGAPRAVHGCVRCRRAPVDPGQAHHRSLLRARRAARPARRGRAGAAPLRARPQPERVAARHRGRLQRAGQRVRADAAPRACRRSPRRVDRRPADLRVDASACRAARPRLRSGTGSSG